MSATPSGEITRMPEYAQVPHGIKQGYKFSDLPLPEDRDGGKLGAWNEKFVPSLLSWVGAHEDPFTVNSELYDVVTHIWDRIFPDITLLNKDLRTLVKVVSHMV